MDDTSHSTIRVRASRRRFNGLRWGEVAGLRLGQLDIADRTLAVTETVVRGRKGMVGFGQPKSAAGRWTLAVPVELMEMLTEHIAARAGRRSAPVLQLAAALLVAGDHRRRAGTDGR